MTTLYFEQQKTYFLVVLVFILAAAVLLALVLWPRRPYIQIFAVIYDRFGFAVVLVFFPADH